MPATSKRVFLKLDALGAIREVDADNRHKALAVDYVKAIAEGKSALVVSPTHAEGEKVTAAIRESLKATGKLSLDERPVQRLTNLHWTEAQRKDARNYRPGQVVQFHQNAPGFIRCDKATVVDVRHDRAVLVASPGQQPRILPQKHSHRFSVYETRTLRLSKGDAIRITQNGTTADGKHRLNNGAVYKVKAVGSNWQIG